MLGRSWCFVPCRSRPPPPPRRAAARAALPLGRRRDAGAAAHAGVLPASVRRGSVPGLAVRLQPARRARRAPGSARRRRAWPRRARLSRGGVEAAGHVRGGRIPLVRRGQPHWASSATPQRLMRHTRRDETLLACGTRRAGPGCAAAATQWCAEACAQLPQWCSCGPPARRQQWLQRRANAAYHRLLPLRASPLERSGRLSSVGASVGACRPGRQQGRHGGRRLPAFSAGLAAQRGQSIPAGGEALRSGTAALQPGVGGIRGGGAAIDVAGSLLQANAAHIAGRASAPGVL